MNTFKRIASAVSVCAVLAGTFAGCSGGTQETKEAKIWMNVGHSKTYWEEKVYTLKEITQYLLTQNGTRRLGETNFEDSNK